MTDLLLDTNAVLRLISSESVPEPARYALLAPSNMIYCSAASSWEIAIKTHKGRLDDAGLLTHWDAWLEEIGSTTLPITAEDGIHAGLLDWDHADPFDRVIVAQARRRGLTVVTSDRAILRSGLVKTLEF